MNIFFILDWDLLILIIYALLYNTDAGNKTAKTSVI